MVETYSQWTTPGSQALRRNTGPPIGPQQIVSLSYLHNHMLHPSQTRIQDYSEILDEHRAT